MQAEETKGTQDLDGAIQQDGPDFDNLETRAPAKSAVGALGGKSKPLSGAPTLRKAARRAGAATKVLRRDSVTAKNEQKFEVKIELTKMDVQVEKTCIMRAQIRNPGLFKLTSKKYRVPEPDDFASSSKKTFNAYVEFVDDSFNKVTGIPRNPSAEGSPYLEKKVLFEVLVIGEDKKETTVHVHEIELSQYSELQQQKLVEVKDTSDGPVTQLRYNIELVLQVDDDSAAISRQVSQSKVGAATTALHSNLSAIDEEEINKINIEQQDKIDKLSDENKKLSEQNTQLHQELQKMRDEADLNSTQMGALELLKRGLSDEMQKSQDQVLDKDQEIQRLRDQIEKQKVEFNIAEWQKLSADKDREMNTLKEEMKDQVKLKNEIFDLKQTIQDLGAEIAKKDLEREQGLEMNLEDTQLVKTLRSEMTQVEKDYDEARNELAHTKYALTEQVEKFEKYELQMRNVKRDHQILDKFVRIETRSPQTILDEFRSGRTSDDQMLSNYQSSGSNSTDAKQSNNSDAPQVNSPYPYSYRAVSMYNLNIDANIY